MTIALDYPAKLNADHSSVEREFGLFSASDVAALVGTRIMNKSKRQLISVVREGETMYPGFQFDQASGSIHSSTAEVATMARTNKLTGDDLVQWMSSRPAILNGFRPVDLVAHHDLLVLAFKNRYPQLSW